MVEREDTSALQPDDPDSPDGLRDADDYWVVNHKMGTINHPANLHWVSNAHHSAMHKSVR